MSSQKRKHECETSGGAKRKQTCIIHSSQAHCEQSTFLVNCKDPDSRFEKLKQIRNWRLQEEVGSPKRLEPECSQIPEEYLPEHGYHRECYQRFIRNLTSLQAYEVDENPSKISSRKRRSESVPEKIIFNQDCIFCNIEGKKSVKRAGLKTTEKTTLFESDGWKTVLKAAELKKDEKLLTRIGGIDLFAFPCQNIDGHLST